jgi:histidine ammonia-lyase
MTGPVEIGAGRVSIAAVVALAEGCTPIRLSDQTRGRIAAARTVVDRYAQGDEPIYGLNTGLGGNVGHRVQSRDIEAFQAQIIRGRCIGMGPPLPEPVARAALLCRIVGMAQGGSGVSAPALDQLVAMFNAGITPVIPSRGSIGAADLGLCAHMAAVAIGYGEATIGGARMPGAQALAAAGLAPVGLAPKDGLSLCNASAVSAAHAAITLAALARLLTVSLATAALSVEGYAANPTIFDARLAAARPAAGQALAAAAFRRALEGSSLHDGAPRAIQDAISFRALAPIWGPMIESYRAAAEAVETEINAAGDNPLVLDDDGLMLSTANFHTPAIALAFDTLAIVMVHLATASAQRTIKLMTPHLSGLPKYLSPVGGSSAGLNPLQKTAAALHAEARLKAQPASLDALPVSDAVEDHAPQTPLTIRKLAEQIELARMLTAIEALTAAQAVDLRAPARLAGCTRTLHTAIRARVPTLTTDRESGPDASRIEALFEDRAFCTVLARHFDGVGLPFTELA